VTERFQEHLKARRIRQRRQYVNHRRFQLRELIERYTLELERLDEEFRPNAAHWRPKREPRRMLLSVERVDQLLKMSRWDRAAALDRFAAELGTTRSALYQWLNRHSAAWQQRKREHPAELSKAS
jgi:hypothetical protein